MTIRGRCARCRPCGRRACRDESALRSRRSGSRPTTGNRGLPDRSTPRSSGDLARRKHPTCRRDQKSADPYRFLHRRVQPRREPKALEPRTATRFVEPILLRWDGWPQIAFDGWTLQLREEGKHSCPISERDAGLKCVTLAIYCPSSSQPAQPGFDSPTLHRTAFGRRPVGSISRNASTKWSARRFEGEWNE